jgi:hypothetical protein
VASCGFFARFRPARSSRHRLEGTYCNVVDGTNLVVYRRPLPTTNFGALGTVLWDGLGNVIRRRSTVTSAITIGPPASLRRRLLPSPDQVNEVVALMRSLTTAQTFEQLREGAHGEARARGPEAWRI